MPQHAKKIIKTLLWLVVTVLVVSFIIFGLMDSAPQLPPDGPGRIFPMP